ncbi:MAG TPA: hypothetical protein VFJ90_02390 [Candidatus Didemnitutus sp.]|nr:hypothetical protein [Candidatus Didemnitutus sp.]
MNRFVQTAARRRTLPALLAGIALMLALRAETNSTTRSTDQAKPAMKQFVIIFRQGPYQLTDAEKERRQTTVSAWARDVMANGHNLDPRILEPESSTPGVAMSPDARGSWPVTALLFLEARDIEEASHIAAAHPAKEYNVSVEVRPWAPPHTQRRD